MKQLGFACCQVVQKPVALSFHVPVFLEPDSARGSRVILPSGVNVILNLVPPGVEAVEGLTVEEGCLDVVRGHLFSSEGGAPSEEYGYDGYWSGVHQQATRSHDCCARMETPKPASSPGSATPPRRRAE